MGEFKKDCIYELSLDNSIWCVKLCNADLNNLQMRSKELITDCIELEDKYHFFNLFLAITLVKRDYLSINHKTLDDLKDCQVCKDGKRKKSEESLLERTFAYELYRQWQNILDATGSSLHVDAEIGKKLSNESINFQKLKSMKGDYKEPDLVLHKSQGNNENQTFVCEIKRNVNLDDEKVINDILKLCHFIDPKIWGGNPYKYGIFIVIKKDMVELTTQIKGLKNKLCEEIKKSDLDVDLSRIICLTYDGDIVKYEVLNNILSI